MLVRLSSTVYWPVSRYGVKEFERHSHVAVVAVFLGLKYSESIPNQSLGHL